MTSLEKDKKVFLSLSDETNKLISFYEQYSLDEISKNSILAKAISYDILRLSRTYKKLGGRYAKRLGEYHAFLLDTGSAIESDIASSLHYEIISKAKEILPLLLERLSKIVSSL